MGVADSCLQAANDPESTPSTLPFHSITTHPLLSSTHISHLSRAPNPASASHCCHLEATRKQTDRQTDRPVVAVDVIQPAALLDHLYGARHILPGGEAVKPLVLVTVARFDAAAVGALLLPARVVVGAFLRLRAA